jgi:hypothetical protein
MLIYFSKAKGRLTCLQAVVNHDFLWEIALGGLVVKSWWLFCLMFQYSQWECRFVYHLCTKMYIKSTWGAEARGWWDQSQPELYSEILS